MLLSSAYYQMGPRGSAGLIYRVYRTLGHKNLTFSVTQPEELGEFNASMTTKPKKYLGQILVGEPDVTRHARGD